MPSYDSEKDFDLFKHAARCMYVRAVDFADLTGRGQRALQRRLQKLVARGYFTWIESPYNSDERVYYLTQPGWDRALEIQATEYEVNANREKKDGQLKHDLQLTRLYVAVYLALSDRLDKWSQLFAARKTRWDDGPEDYVNADAVFSVRDTDGTYTLYFVEIENQKGVEEPLRKMRGYLRFLESGAYQEKFKSPAFRVLMLKPTEEMAGNVLEDAGEDRELASDMFLLSDYANPLVYRTPADYEIRTHGLVKG